VEPFTLNRKFLKENVIDTFHSLIWTERYYGDGDVELTVPPTVEMIQKLMPGTFLGLPESDEVMILETFTIEEGVLKVTGTSLLPWFNNRFVRTSPDHKADSWTFPTGGTPGWVLWAIIWNMCHKDSPYLQGSIPMGVPNPQQLIIPGLALKDYDKTGTPITPIIPYGPVYDVLRAVATTYRIGMQITLDAASDTGFTLGFRSYKGLNRTSSQTENAAVRFSPHMDSLTNIKELQSIAALKTLVYSYASSVTSPVPAGPGVAALSGPQYTGFDLRALTIQAENLPTTGLTAQQLIDALNSQAKDALNASPFVKAVDGEIVPENQFQYGRDYNLGDIIEVQGNSDVVQSSRVTEYIRAQDEAGEKAYPTVAMLD
jgi:Siphovirus ReqiPepy6 Gp37-like protein